MHRNSYDTLLEPWKLELIDRRARQRGLRGADFQDAQQTLVLELLQFTFDPAKAKGATETTAVVAVIDRRLAMLHRRERRHEARTERLKESLASAHATGSTVRTEGDDVSRLSLACDVREAIADLPPLAQQICVAMVDGQSVNRIAKDLGLPWRAVRTQVDGIRRYFAHLGLGRSAEASQPEVEDE